MSKYVIIDLEMCNVPKGFKRSVYNLKSELIQIGAVVVDESLSITDEFMTHVSPEHGMIDAYIENLTGISRSDVQGASQIRKELEAKGLVIEGLEYYLDNWIDCQKTFGEKMNANKNYKLSEALIIADICYDDGEHDALVDAKNTAQLFIKMQREPELKLNSYYSSKTEELTYRPFAALLANYTIAG